MTTKEKVFLFDMDGTLTPARKCIEPNMIKALKELSKHARIGVITGSDYDYIMEQLGALFDAEGIPLDKIDLLPCNGTKKYVHKKDYKQGKGFDLVSEADMLNEIGRKKYNEVVRLCVEWQVKIMNDFKLLPYTGTFLQYRGSLLNWCPIGRDADTAQREAWIDADNKNKIRNLYASLLSTEIEGLGGNLTAALGGSTSLDIYPKVWDKTYGLKHYPGADVYFTGDRCEKGGNDWHIYETLKSEGKAFHIHDTSETIDLINGFIEDLQT